MATTRSAPDRTETTARSAVHPARQALRLTRVEFTQMWRYRTALFYVVAMPLVMAFILLSVPVPDFLPGVDGAAFNLVNIMVLLPPLLGLLHVSNLYAVRREQMVLKRLRISGVPAVSIFAATALSVVLVVLLQSLFLAGAVAAAADTLPAEPVLLVLALTAGAVMMTFFGAALTRLVRNAEGAQMINVFPLLAIMLTAGVTAPLDVFPDTVARILWFTPLAPITDLVRSAYFGYDFFGGIDGAAQVGTLELWAAAGPALLVTAGWVAVSCLLLRSVRWDPRQAK